MTNSEQRPDFKDKLLKGFELMYERLLEYKIQKKSVLVIMQKDQIIKADSKKLKRKLKAQQTRS